MCRNIKPLFNFDPPVTDEEVQAAALQFVRKISGFQQPSTANNVAFNQAVDEIADASQKLFAALTTSTTPKNRLIEAEKRKQRFLNRQEAKG
jgi:hypothetical protein